MQDKKHILVTGGAGFIGSHLVAELLQLDYHVTALDNLNSAYDQQLKRQNVIKHPNCIFIEGDIRDSHVLQEVFKSGPFDVVVHLAAMSGVRASLTESVLYTDVNVTGTQTLINSMQKNNCRRLVFASSSAVYGARSGEPFLETDSTSRPQSPYAASKLAGELLAYSAHNLNVLNVVCLRFFSVFGPRQNPRVGIQKFMRLIDQGKPIEVYGNGSSSRDYIYVSDIVSGIIASIESSLISYEVINLGRSQPVTITSVIEELERMLNKKAEVIYKAALPEEMPYTYANIEKASHLLNFQPKVSFQAGVEKLVSWYSSNRDVRR